MTWSPLTYDDAHREDDDFDPSAKVPCSKCERLVWPWVLQDMRALPGIEYDWLCDGCRSDMHRRLVPVDGGPPPKTRREWTARLMKAHGAPQEVITMAESRRLNGFEKDRDK